MANKRCWLGILVMVLVFGMTVAGCASVLPPNYYNLGDVSEENCAIIDVEVSPGAGGFFGVRNFISIDGQEYPGRRGSLVKTLVRVTPGNHTFTMNFVYDMNGKSEDIPVSITFDCKAGMGYTFQLMTKLISIGTIDAEITIFGYTVDQNGNFGLWPSIVRETKTLSAPW